MSALPTPALAFIANALLPLALTALCASYARSRHAARLLAEYARRVERDLRYLQRPWSARQVIFAHAAALIAALAVFAVFAACGHWLSLALPACLALAPHQAMKRARRARTARIEAQLDTWLVVLSNALRATASLGHAIDASATRIAAPLQDELRLTLHETRLGAPLDRALFELGERVGSATLCAALTTLRIARSSGGDLSATLDGAAASLREMARLEGVIRTRTAEGRAQSSLIAVIPIPLCALLDTLSPDLLAPLWNTPRGHLVLAGACALWLIALLLARKITAVEV